MLSTGVWWAHLRIGDDQQKTLRNAEIANDCTTVRVAQGMYHKYHIAQTPLPATWA
jgi:hypothetical protein